MIRKQFSLVLDVGTTGVKAFIFDSKQNLLAKEYLHLNKFVKGNRVEQDPMEILKKSRLVMLKVLKASGIDPKRICKAGITNQRETIIAWSKTDGKPIYSAIVWEDNRTKNYCLALIKKYQKFVQNKTGLPIEAYFSASKIAWIIDNVKAAKPLLAAGQLSFGTIDSWILWNFVKNHPHLTDRTNASRTLLYNIKRQSWDDELLKLFNIPKQCLPKVLPSISYFGSLDGSISGLDCPVLAVCGDQQASTYAAGIKPRSTKVTFGTGTFIVQITDRFLIKSGFYTTITPSLNKPKYALEAKIGWGGKKIEEVLDNRKKLNLLIRQLIDETAIIIHELPYKPLKIIVDGGVSRNEPLIRLLRQKTGIIVVEQKIFDGTALGIAKMLK